MGRKIVVASGKGGVGKTTIVAGLARSLSLINISVCVLDADVGLNNLDIIMNVENKVVYDLVDCMQGKCRIQQAIIKDSFADNLYTMPAGKQIKSNTPISFESIVNKLASIFDYVLIDSPAGIDEGFIRAVSCADECIVVVTPHISSVRDASKVLSILSGTNKYTYMAINRMRGDLVASGEMMNHTDIQSLLNTKLVAVLPESDTYNTSSKISFSNSNDELKLALDIMAKNIVNNTNIVYDYRSKYMGFIGYIRRKFKRL